MDPISFTASIISLATLAVQLGDALRKAADFWESVQDAPSNIRRLSRELRLVANVFDAIRVEYEAGSVPTSFEKMLKEALELAKDDISQLSELISELSRKLSTSGGSVGKQWRKVQMALRASKLEKFKGDLESVKSTLNLLQASRQQSALIQFNSRIDILSTNFISMNETSSNKIRTKQHLMDAPQLSTIVSGRDWRGSIHGVSRSVRQWKSNFLLGTFSYKTTSTTHRYDDNDVKDNTNNPTTIKTFVVEFLVGFIACRKGLRVMMTDSFDRYSLDVIRKRPNDSEIFNLCLNGNVNAVKLLLDHGEASIHDVEENGSSLLHKAVRSFNPQLCQMLLHLGADIHLRANCGMLPIQEAMICQQSACYIAIIEAGYDIWALDGSIGKEGFYLIHNSVSAWRYIHQFKPAASVGYDLIMLQMRALRETRDLEEFDFLVQRLDEELSQPGESERYLSKLTFYRTLMQLARYWLSIMFDYWFANYDHYMPVASLSEYKLIQIFKQLSHMLSSINDKKWYAQVERLVLDSLLIDIAEEIVKTSCWSTGACNVIFRQWSKIIFPCGIDLYDIGQRAMGTDALERYRFDCCRVIRCEVVYGDQHEDLSLKIDNSIAPKFSHLDPLFLCGAGRPRRDRTGPGRCLSRVSETFIKDGRFCMNMPGQWEEPRVPNTELVLRLAVLNLDLSRISYCWKFDDDIYPEILES
ncbi:hypothetical protein DSL72_007161 [Monilinia vaccinii-corymbosi]|uniref:Azaphilone pigments biosynthesis cluster protein L N-terminal domain-containing protein n=1 Tax=Monilinia vaccinii-corymbosi TaxID=61207 RepID=A0A8A3PKV0_9HELO|nr:hypothetical protein DSL72_007161 [Monilinia vaccinii-corymbosi]